MTTCELTFETKDRNQGQIVTYSHARTRSGATIDRRHDGSDGSIRYYWRRSGRRLSEAEMTRYGLIER